MKYANDQERQYLNYHRLYTAKTVRRVSIYDDGKYIVVERAIDISGTTVFKNFKGYNWLLLAVGLCYIILAIIDSSEDKKEECEECKEKQILHFKYNIANRKVDEAIIGDHNAVDIDFRKDPVEANDHRKE